MGDIKTKVSALENYLVKQQKNYDVFVDVAYSILSDVNQNIKYVQQKEEYIGRQIVRINQMLSEVSRQEKIYLAHAEDANRQMNYYAREASRINNSPIYETRYDNEGNSYTVSYIDEYALKTVRSSQNLATMEFNSYCSKASLMGFYKTKIQNTLADFQETQKGILQVLNIITQAMYDIKKYLSGVQDESHYNQEAIVRVVRSLEEYLKCKSFYLPRGASYIEFVNSVEIASLGASFSPQRPKSILSEKDFDKLDFSERKALLDYISDGFKMVNKVLRGQNVDYISENQKEMVHEEIHNLQQALSKCSLSDEATLYRGISSPTVVLGSNWKDKSIEELQNQFIGTHYQDFGFESTSTSRDIAERFANTIEGTVLIIHAPRGTKAIEIGNRGADQENEVLLQNGMSFKIVNILQNNTMGYVIEMEIDE